MKTLQSRTFRASAASVVGITMAATVMVSGLMPASAQAAYDPMRPQASPSAPASGEAAVKPNPELGNLPDAEGADTTYYMCSVCHSTAIILQQRVTDARWDDLWLYMTKDQGMNDPGPETKAIILGYLKRHFSSER